MNRYTNQFVTGLTALLLAAVTIFASSTPAFASPKRPSKPPAPTKITPPAPVPPKKPPVVSKPPVAKKPPVVNQPPVVVKKRVVIRTVVVNGRTIIVSQPVENMGPDAPADSAVAAAPADPAVNQGSPEPVVQPLNVPPATLFSQYVSDPKVRALASARFNAHNTLTRNDMIDILRQAGKAGPLSLNELNSLRAIVADAAMLHMADYVRDLSTKILFGNAANGHFQGKRLGNLAAGSSANQLELLVKKWFLGADRPAIDSQYHYEYAQGILYNGVPRITDIDQGDLGDCYFISALGDTALLNWKKVAGMFIDNGDKTFTVRFYRNGRASYVTVDRFLPVDGDKDLVFDGGGRAADDAKKILWVALAEKAYAQTNESGWLGVDGPQNGVNSYAALGPGGYGNLALSIVTGLPSTRANLSSINSVNIHELTLADTKDDNTAKSLVPHHTYAVTGYNAATHTVTLFNPWTTGGEDGVKYGSFTINWNDFVANFSAVYHSTRPA
jgi:hypothetical protein